MDWEAAATWRLLISCSWVTVTPCGNTTKKDVRRRYAISGGREPRCRQFVVDAALRRPRVLEVELLTRTVTPGTRLARLTLPVNTTAPGLQRMRCE